MGSKRVLFIDRDGTLIKEPPVDFQVDKLEKFSLFDNIFPALKNIKTLADFEWAMITNQDGLGTDSFPSEDFWPLQKLTMDILKSQGVDFDEVFIDPSLPEENSPNRKPRTGMLGKYLSGDYDLANSIVIGDRLSDVELAKNLGAKAIYIQDLEIGKKEIIDAGFVDETILISKDWRKIEEIILGGKREAEVSRKTKETEIYIKWNLDESSESKIDTGLKFFDHMLDQLGKHSETSLEIKVRGDLEVDEHHTIEDTAIALGQVFKEAIGDKKGINRYGFLLPMDDVLTQVALDLSNRPWLVWDAEFKREMVGDMPTEMFMHFFKSFSDEARINLNIKSEGGNEHHKIESIFKALAKSIKMAIKRDVVSGILPTTKGII
jgi:imidazoleglycerol-phosphate dehydratase/histidinol-phosphatase